MPVRPDVAGYDFLHHGKIGALMRDHDWSGSRLGAPATWSQSLKTIVGVMLGLHQPMVIVWGPEHLLLYNDAYATLLGQRHPQALGQSFFDSWPEIEADVRPIIETAYAGLSTHMDHIVLFVRRNGYPEETHFTFSCTPVPDEAGRVVGIVCACTETTEEIKARRALKAETKNLRELFQQAPGFMCVMRGPTHVFEFANNAYLERVGRRDIIGKPIREALPELTGQGFFELHDRVYASGNPFVGHDIRSLLRRTPEGSFEERFMDFVYQPITNNDGEVMGIFVEGYDVTDRKLAEERRTLLINELNHRVKNTLATVQSLAHQSFKGKHCDAKLRKSFEDRLIALAKAHDVLTRENWEGAELGEIIAEVVAPYARQGKQRFDIEGPRLRLDPEIALSLAIALHELTTNAAKYGALSVPPGRVKINWTVSGGEPSHFVLRWRERGGPFVLPPTRKGFGTRLIERSLAREPSGAARLSYEPGGLVCVLSASLTAQKLEGQQSSG